MDIFFQDIQEKKRIAASAHKKYRPGRVPNINQYTEKELCRMNGEVKTYNLSMPMAWEPFMEMPIDVQKEYVEKMMEKYEIGPVALAEMFGVAAPMCGMYIREVLGVSVKGRSTVEKKRQFMRAMIEKADSVYRPDDQLRREANEKKKREEAARMVMPTVALTFEGPFSPTNIVNSIAALYAPGTNVTVTVQIDAF